MERIVRWILVQSLRITSPHILHDYGLWAVKIESSISFHDFLNVHPINKYPLDLYNILRLPRQFQEGSRFCHCLVESRSAGSSLEYRYFQGHLRPRCSEASPENVAGGSGGNVLLHFVAMNILVDPGSWVPIVQPRDTDRRRGWRLFGLLYWNRWKSTRRGWGNDSLLRLGQRRNVLGDRGRRGWRGLNSERESLRRRDILGCRGHL